MVETTERPLGKQILPRRIRRYMVIKDILDRLFALLVLVLFWWILLFIAIAIVIEDGRPVVFRQKRLGKDGKYFQIFKFRTMRRDTPRDMPTHLLDDPERYITKVGGFLRRASLDELPQLLNILMGQMSFVGPRPILYNEVRLLQRREDFKANNVRPGLTGWAQINGRDELEDDQKAELDGYYVANMGLRMDIRCFFGTFLPVLRQQGVVEGNPDKKRQNVKPE